MDVAAENVNLSQSTSRITLNAIIDAKLYSECNPTRLH
jgi:hypothetical protein